MHYNALLQALIKFNTYIIIACALLPPVFYSIDLLAIDMIHGLKIVLLRVLSYNASFTLTSY